MNTLKEDCKNLNLKEMRDKYIGAKLVQIINPNEIPVIVNYIERYSNSYAFGRTSYIEYFMDQYMIKLTEKELLEIKKKELENLTLVI